MTYFPPAINVEGTLLASAARTATTTTDDQTNEASRSLRVLVNVTVITTILTPSIQGKDPVSGMYYDVLVGNEISSTGLFWLDVASMAPRTWRAVFTHPDATSMTYSASFALGV